MENDAPQLLRQLQDLHPVVPVAVTAAARTGLVIVDIVDGFCRPGAGPLAPQAPDPRIEAIIDAVDLLARQFSAKRAPIYIVRDQHERDRPEPPYPPHCIRGSGHENLVERLAWLNQYELAEDHTKDCINLIVGSQDADGRVGFYEWIRDHRLEQVVFVGICTEICIADPVLTLLSARNHAGAHQAGVTGSPTGVGGLRDVVVYEPGCATYHLPPETVEALNLPGEATHDAGIAHHTGLWMMQSRGAIIAKSICEEGEVHGPRTA